MVLLKGSLKQCSVQKNELTFIPWLLYPVRETEEMLWQVSAYPSRDWIASFPVYTNIHSLKEWTIKTYGCRNKEVGGGATGAENTENTRKHCSTQPYSKSKAFKTMLYLTWRVESTVQMRRIVLKWKWWIYPTGWKCNLDIVFVYLKRNLCISLKIRLVYQSIWQPWGSERADLTYA